MANRVLWDPRFAVGNQTIDAEHESILAQINAMADCLAVGGEEGDRRFLSLFGELKNLARRHFAAEEALLAAAGYPDLEEHKAEQEEYAYLEAEIVTTENFDKTELQTFLSLWWSGHVVTCARARRAWLERPTQS